MDKIFLLPVIEDKIAKQEGNFSSLIDLEDGFHQMHLEEECWHLPAFVTPFGVYEWKVLPMGVKVGPQVFQRLVQWVVRNCPFSDPYIHDVLTSTAHSCKYDASARGRASCLISMLWMISQHFCSLVFPRPRSFLMVLRTLICGQNFSIILLRVPLYRISYTFIFFVYVS